MCTQRQRKKGKVEGTHRSPAPQVEAGAGGVPAEGARLRGAVKERGHTFNYANSRGSVLFLAALGL